jgi:hypothetical protein
MSTVTFFHNIDTINHFKIYGLIINASLAAPIFRGLIKNFGYVDNLLISFFKDNLFVLELRGAGLHISNILL